MRITHYCVPVKNSTVMVHFADEQNFYGQLHKHNETQITLILHDEGSLLVNNNWQTYEPGDVFLIGSNEPHVFKAAPSLRKNHNLPDPQAIHILFDHREKWAGVVDLPEFQNIRQFLLYEKRSLQLHAKHRRLAKHHIKKINRAEGLNRFIALLELLGFFAGREIQWKAISSAYVNHHSGSNEESRISQVLNYARANYWDDISLSKIAAVAHMTPPAFCKFFKKHTTKKWVFILNEIRVHEACKGIIRNNGDSIASAAYAAGFKNMITFNRVFKKVTGMCPTDFLKKVNQPG